MLNCFWIAGLKVIRLVHSSTTAPMDSSERNRSSTAVKTPACMTVLENLELGAYLRKDTEEIKRDIEKIFELFPRLKERVNQAGITLSGGEQQMLAMGRALLSNPDILLMDEPSMGLSPLLVDQQFELIQQINRQGTTIFMVEQNANMALSIADRGYVLQTGSIVLSDTARNLLCNQMMQEAYLGGADACETPT